MNRPTRVALIALVILLLLGSSVYALRAYSNKRKLNALKSEVAEMMNSQEGGPFGPRGEGREKMREIRDQVDQLPDAYQKSFRQSMQSMFRKREEQRLDDYFRLSQADRVKELDKRIEQGEKRRKEWEARRNNQAGGPGGNGNGGNGNGASANAGGQNGGNNRGPGGGPGGPGGNGPRGPGGGGLGARLDNTSPELRAKQTEYRHQMDLRRAELGLPPRGGRR